MSQTPARARRRDAARSREELLNAAGELFAERGFERTTTREIGERAGVDPALIARYFGGKTQLYLALVQAEHGDETPADLLDTQRLGDLFELFERRTSPILQIVMQPSGDPSVQEAAQAHLDRRLVDPLRERFERDGLDRPELRAELAAAAFSGVILARSAGTLGHLAGAQPTEVLDLLHQLLSGAGGHLQPADAPADEP
ncbi:MULTISPECIES: helix-turn-helix domain-containing protein [unclassified Kitasatospora]|uniref:TetR/AcrR family transcriptional regulator n=1 Tax=unclassified Kitasatospora TaxID=2633591 RepID=UPI0033ECE480